ncbi:MAG: hypothetical protein HYY01_13535 [Chloroflexi bacterium]|nr:hypothetical protein [Chloroflexota bacterium]
MRKSVPVLGIYVGLALLAGIAALGNHNGDSASGPAAVATQSAPVAYLEQLVATEAELAVTREDLVATRAELAASRDTLVAAQAEATSTKEVLMATQAQLVASRDVLSTTQGELAWARAALATVNAQVRRNPTYADAVQFLKADQTDRNKYDFDTYNCRDFSADVLRNADALGIRAAFISIRLSQGSHAVVGFETVDRGMVYFEPQTDKEVVLPVGESYLRANGYKPLPDRDDTITRVTVIW